MPELMEIRWKPLEENILGLVHQYVASMLEKEKKVSSKRQCEYKEINTAELQKQSRQLTSEKMKLYDDYKDGRMSRDLYKQRAEKISGQLDEIKRKIEDADNPEEWLDEFNTFSIYQVLSKLIELWGMNIRTDVEAKKNFIQQTVKCPLPCFFSGVCSWGFPSGIWIC